MNNLKFRVLNKINKEIIVFDLFQTSQLKLDELDINSITLFTGLTDKNGREIYGGDKIFDGVSEKEIEWDNAGARFYTVEPTKKAWVNCEVVGNIYESIKLKKKNAK